MSNPNYPSNPPDEVKSEVVEQEKKLDFETFHKLAEMLQTNPNINFTIAARGNITADPRGDDAGARVFQYNKGQKKMVQVQYRLSGLDSQTWWANQLKEQPGVFEKVPYTARYDKTFLVGFRQFQVGSKAGKYNRDSRQGAFFAGFEAPLIAEDDSNYTQEELKVIDKLLTLEKSDPEQFIQMFEAFCRHYVPEYYKEQEEIEKTIKKFK